MSAALLELEDLSVGTPEGRPLFRDLGLSVGRDRVAIVGRNGVGKSTLLEILAGRRAPDAGRRVARVEPVLVPQQPDPEQARQAAEALCRRALRDPAERHAIERERIAAGLPPLAALVDGPSSRGEARKLLLVRALLERPPMLLLDEPTEDLDEAGIAWLCERLRRWDGGLVVVSHHRGLLRELPDFFVVAESGCRHLPGPFDALQRTLEQEDEARQQQYVRNLNALAEQEQRDERIRRRRERKKNVGRLHELRRRTSRARLNEKRGHAQQSQARAARIRRDRIETARAWAKATRRALSVSLPLELPSPELPPDDGQPAIVLEGVEVCAAGRPLLSALDLRIGRERLAVMGPNGAGKTSLLRVMLGQRSADAGSVRLRAERIGAIAQGATDWESDESLLWHLHQGSPDATLEQLATMLVEHRFPLALAQRPLRSLSPGERVRAALLCLFARAPAVDLLVLDEPTNGLDFVGMAALQRALRAWPGGLVVASHDRELLEAIGIQRVLVLDGRGSWTSRPEIGLHQSSKWLEVQD